MLRKYTLYLAGVLALVLGSVGCGEHHHSGYLDATWTILDSRTGLQGSCEWAGITEIEIAARDTYTSQDYRISYPCSAYRGLSDPLPESNYWVAVYGYSPANDLLSSDMFDNAQFPVYVGRDTPVPAILYYP